MTPRNPDDIADPTHFDPPLDELKAIMREPYGLPVRRRILAFLRTGGHPNGPSHNPPGDNWGKRILRSLPQWLWR